ncbi:nucleolin 2-like isoform X2 [Andrographis paniculata]|uniref:nucleolin 2-like isoform X2 n=1 Tax=Andrographis paniculata TaxID=175694 RepID=UPI0021E78996|nr:nucleolin 2-like isoform X2 [Andrographis paniculata]
MMTESKIGSAFQEVAAAPVGDALTSPLGKAGRRKAEDADMVDEEKAPLAEIGCLDSDLAGDGSALEGDTSGSKKTPAIAPEDENLASDKKIERNDVSNSSLGDEASLDGDVVELVEASLAPTENDPPNDVKESSADLEDKTIKEEPQKKKFKTMNCSSFEAFPKDENSSEEQEKITSASPMKIDMEVEMTDAAKTAKNADNVGSLLENAPEIPSSPKEQKRGPKSVFVGNLSFSIERDDVENFLQAAGEVVANHFAINSDGTFRGYGYVEFASSEAAEKAVRELNGKELLRRPVKIDFVREKSSLNPYRSVQDTKSHKVQTIYIRGFDKHDGIDQIKRSLEQHFGLCGEMTRLTIPKDYDGSIKGIAYIDFKEKDAYHRALELDGSEIGGNPLAVEPAKPRPTNHDNISGGRWAGSGFGGRLGGSGGWGFGGRFGGGGRGFGGRFGSSGGWGFGGRFGGGGRGFGGRFGGGGRGFGDRFGGVGCNQGWC